MEQYIEWRGIEFSLLFSFLLMFIALQNVYTEAEVTQFYCYVEAAFPQSLSLFKFIFLAEKSTLPCYAYIEIHIHSIF